VVETQVLSEFFRTIWREEKGYVYIATKNPTNGEWGRKFFEWPIEEPILIQSVLNDRASQEVYFAPSIFRERSSRKEAVLGSFCFWIEFDGAMPVEFDDIPNPSMIVQTSTETHQHIYWCVDQFMTDVDKIEHVNKSLAYKFKADVSGWDINQVLRPPETLNHKKKLKATLVAKSDRFLSSVAFSDNLHVNLPPKIEVVEAPLSLSEVVRKYPFDRKVWELFVKGTNGVDRSNGLMSLGYSLAEMNLTNLEIYTMLLDADKRWGKFHNRDDQHRRLTDLIAVARVKYPYKISTSTQESLFITMSDRELITTEIKVDWLWEGILHQTGYLLLTGHTGVGKSQFSLDFGAHLVLGKAFLGRAIHTKKKVAFISLEMGLLELKLVRQAQLCNYSEEEQLLISEGLRHLPVGYPIYFNREENKRMVEELIQREGIECIIFDSLGSMTEQELSKETDAKNLMDWNDHLRAELGISTIIIHHHRKAQSGNKRPNTISDIYGSHYFTARATTVMTMWDSKKAGLIEVSFQKMRLSKRESPWAIRRKDDLTFEITSDKIEFIDDTVDEVDITTPESTDAFEL
jgi:KaiC/GvpD/RAD55 family RecA-like ATPase